MSAKRPTAVTVATSTSRYDSPTHVTAPTEASKVCCSVGRATVTMDASSWPMKAPTHTAATANQGASVAPGWPAGRRGSTSNRSHVHVHGRGASDVAGSSPVTSRRRLAAPRDHGARPDVARRGPDEHLVTAADRTATRGCPRPSSGRRQRPAPPRPSPARRPPTRLSRTPPVLGRAAARRDSGARR